MFQYLTKQDRVWITKSGDAIPIKEMSANHLGNALKMLLRLRVASDYFTSDPLKAEVAREGYTHVINVLIKEQKRRQKAIKKYNNKVDAAPDFS